LAAWNSIAFTGRGTNELEVLLGGLNLLLIIGFLAERRMHDALENVFLHSQIYVANRRFEFGTFNRYFPTQEPIRYEKRSFRHF
jgi:hypothetical protein